MSYVRDKMLPSAPIGVQAVLAGDLDVAYAPVEVAVQAVARGADLKTFGNGSANPSLFLVVGHHVDTPNAVKGYPALMQDVKSKRVGVTARGSSAEFQFLGLLFVAAPRLERSLEPCSPAHRLMCRRIASKPNWLKVLKACPVPMDDLPPRRREYFRSTL